VAAVCRRDPEIIKPEDAPSEAAWNLLVSVIDDPTEWLNNEYRSVKDDRSPKDPEADMADPEETRQVMTRWFVREGFMPRPEGMTDEEIATGPFWP
jgi:hypothetical protein